MSSNCAFIAFFLVISVIYVHYSNWENTEICIEECKNPP